MASSALMQAQARLLALRAQLQTGRDDDGVPWADSPTEQGEPSAAASNPALSNAQKTLAAYRRRDNVRYDAHVPGPVTVAPPPKPAADPPRLPARKPALLPLYKDTIRHYPTLGIAALEHEQAAAYRVWLMGRYLDGMGSGRLDIQQVRDVFAAPGSRLRLCGWRRLRQILGQGHGRFWQWDKQSGCLWLFGAARVAANLDVTRLAGQPVALPIAAITAGIGDFKAHLYAAWHSGRRTDNPITRQKQEELTGIPERTQRHYGRVAQVGVRRNLAIGDTYTKEAAEKTAWRRGQVFTFTDYQGQQGRVGTRYVAWQMPNSYTGPHSGAASGRQRKINRELKDLVDKEAQGNSSQRVRRCYYANGGEAGRAYNRQPDQDVYWPLPRQRRRNSAALWACFFNT